MVNPSLRRKLRPSSRRPQSSAAVDLEAAPRFSAPPLAATKQTPPSSGEPRQTHRYSVEGPGQGPPTLRSLEGPHQPMQPKAQSLAETVSDSSLLVI